MLAKMTLNKHCLKHLLVVHIFSVWTRENNTTTTRSTLYAHLLHLLASRLANKTAPIPWTPGWIPPNANTMFFLFRSTLFFLAKPKLQCSFAPLEAMFLLLLPTTPWWISRRTHRGGVHGRNRRNTSSPTATGLDDPKGGSFAVFLGI